MRKKAFLALMLALTLLALSGCTLIQKDPAVDAATEILRLGDAVVTKGEIQDEVDYQLDYMAYLYSMYGYSYDKTSPENIAEVQASVIDSFKKDLVTDAKMEELGLEANLTEEEQAEIQSNAEETFQDNLNYVLSNYTDDTEMSLEEKTEKATEDLAAMGYTMEEALEDAKADKLNELLREYVVKDVTVSDEEIQADYDSRVASAKETYENNAGSWATAANNGSTLYYTPAGVRYVKQILVKFLDDDQAAIDEANKKADDAAAKATEARAKVTSAESDAEYAQSVLDREDATEEEKKAAQSDLDAANAAKEEAEAEIVAANNEEAAAREEADQATEKAFANIDEAADGILAELELGADWDTLMADRTQDPGMQSGITAERGYAVSADMTSFDSAFVDAAMALQKIGDVSGKVKGTSYGYYIIRYVGDAAEGPIALDEVKESIRSSLQSTKENDTYNNTIQSWVDAASFKEDLKALNK